MRQVFNVVMAAVLVASLCLGSVARGFAQEVTGRPFITKWKGEAGKELKFPIVGTDYKLVIKNEKGEVVKTEEKVTVTGEDDSYYHAFTPTADGVYTVEAGPEGVKYMRMRGYLQLLLTSNAKLLEVVQFGTVVWESMTQMFYRCEKMTFAAGIDTPDLTKVTNMSGMFNRCYTFNQPLNNWNVSKVTDMSEMFAHCNTFNQPLNNWNVSKVTDMRAMFWDCSAFNQPLNNWDVSQVTDMYTMFWGCSAFNQPLGEWKLQTAIGSLSKTAMSVENYSQSLIGWAKQTDGASDIRFRENVKWLVYNDAGKEAREKLIARGWTFEGDVYKPSVKVAISLDKEGEGTLAIEGYNEEALKAVALGTELTVIATPKEGYKLTSLMAGSQDIFATKKFTVMGAVTVTAVFKETPKVAITLKKEGEGTLAIEGYNEEALKTVAVGTELTVIATPKEGYTLTSLMAGTQDILATKMFTVKGAVTVKAVFKKKAAITLAKEGEGTLAIEGYNEEALKAVAVGTELTVIATPKEGYMLTSLTAGTQDILATKRFTVTESVTVKAVFTKNGGSTPGGGNGGNNGGGNNGGNNGGGNNGGGNNGGGSWQPQKPGTAVEDAVLVSLAVAPNPFTSQLRIDNPEGVAVRYELVNASGLVVRAGTFSATEVFVDTEALPAGVYFVRIESQNGAKKVEKVVKY
ncbi:MAG: BspA family leucine-rich repeat surface protein [Bacteroides sp.]